MMLVFGSLAVLFCEGFVCFVFVSVCDHFCEREEEEREKNEKSVWGGLPASQLFSFWNLSVISLFGFSFFSLSTLSLSLSLKEDAGVEERTPTHLPHSPASHN